MRDASHLELLVVNRAEEDVRLQRLAGDPAREHVLTGVTEAAVDEDLLHIFDFRASESSLGTKDKGKRAVSTVGCFFDL
jgi:hypothetical protein